MSIEQLVNPAELNIKNFNIQTPEKGLLEFDIKPDDWRRMEADAKEVEQTYHVWERIADLRLIRPESFPNLPNPATNPELSEQISRRVKEVNHVQAQLVFLDVAASIRQLWPDQWEKFIAREDLENIALRHWNDALYFDLATRMKRLLPERVEVNEEDFTAITLNIGLSKKLKNWPSLAVDMATLRILFPGRFNIQNIGDNAWKGMQQDLRAELKGTNLDKAITLARDMAIISASELKFTNRGLELSPAVQKLPELGSRIPEIKKF